MAYNPLTRRSFVQGLGHTAMLALGANLVKFVPEAQGVLAKSIPAAIITPGAVSLRVSEGYKAQVLGEQSLRDSVGKALQHPNGRALVEFLAQRGYDTQPSGASGLLCSAESGKQMVTLTIPIGGPGTAWLMPFIRGSDVHFLSGSIPMEGGFQSRELYSVDEGIVSVTNSTPIKVVRRGKGTDSGPDIVCYACQNINWCCYADLGGRDICVGGAFFGCADVRQYCACGCSMSALYGYTCTWSGRYCSPDDACGYVN